MNSAFHSVVSIMQKEFEVHDVKGRSLKVRRLNALDRLRLLKAAGSELSQNDAWLNMAALAVSVVGVDGVPRPVPINEQQIESLVSELGDDGLQAVFEGLVEQEATSSVFDGPPPGNVEGTPI